MMFDDLVEALRTSERGVAPPPSSLLEGFYKTPPLDGDLDASVVLLEAPAGVGKTAFTAHLAAESSAAWEPLGGKRLGDHFFTGLASDRYNLGRAALVEALQAGRLSFVLDGADEGLVRSGLDGFEAALRSMAEVLNETGIQDPRVVIAGRPFAMSVVREILDSVGCAACEVHLKFFDPEAAEEFVRERVEHELAGQHIAPKAAPALDAAIEAIVSRSRVLESGRKRAPEGSVVGSFAGYAPVLNACAALIAPTDDQKPREHWEAVSDSFGQQSGGAKTWAFVGNVCSSMLQREQRRLGEALRDELSTESAEYIVRRYGATGQLELMFAARRGSVIAEIVSSIADQREREAAEERIVAQFADHPFLDESAATSEARASYDAFVNPVFRDYAYAAAIVGDIAGSRAELLHELGLNTERLTPALGFLLVDAPFLESSRARVPVDELGAIFHSVMGARGRLPEVSDVFRVESSADPNVAVARITDRADDHDEPSGDFEIEGLLDEPVVFPGGVWGLEVILPEAMLVLTNAGRGGGTGSAPLEVTLGPQVDIECEVFVIEGPLLAVRASEEQPVEVTARSVHTDAGLVARLRVRNPDDFVLRTSDAEGSLPPALAVFRRATQDHVSPQDAEWFATSVRALLYRFSAGSGGSAAFPTRKIETMIAKGRVDDEVVAFFREEGILRREGMFEAFDASAAGVSHVAVREAQTDGLQPLFERFRQWKELRANDPI